MTGNDDHGDRAIYCEDADSYVLGRTEDGRCPFCDADLTGERYERLQERVESDKEEKLDL